MKPINRDDLDPELLAMIEQRFPGMQIVCAGDAPEGTLPPDVVAAMKEVEQLHEASLMNGTCVDCGAQMPNFPTSSESIADDWRPAEGWAWFTNGGEISAWQCPECDRKESEATSE